MSKAKPKPAVSINKGAQALRVFFQSQDAAAARLGIGPSQLSLLLAGRRKPSIEVAAALEREFGVPCILWTQRDEGPK